MNVRPRTLLHTVLKLSALIFLFSLLMPLQAQEGDPVPDEKGKNTLETLRNLVTLQANLKRDIESLNKQIEKAQSESQKQALQQELNSQQDDLNATSRNLENISAGVDLSSLRDQAETKFDFQQELFRL